MNLTDLVTDPYNRRARLMPALFTLLPVGLVALVLFPGLESKLATYLGIAAYFGGAAWLVQLGRERGKRLERTLYHQWGGMPSVALLRHRDERVSPVTKGRYHAFLTTNVPGVAIPTSDEEDSDPKTADEMYLSATDWLLSATRDKQKFRVLFEENMNYGFRRNLWALRPVALLANLMTGLGILAFATTIPAGSTAIQLELSSTVLGAIAIVGIHTLIVANATKGWVRVAAEEYATQLLAACDSLAA